METGRTANGGGSGRQRTLNCAESAACIWRGASSAMPARIDSKKQRGNY